jgi:hypothetical protein
MIATSEPLYDAKRDVIFDPRLVGLWGNADQVLRISAAADHGYELTQSDVRPAAGGQQEQQQAVRAELVKIGRYRYLFLCPPDLKGTLLFPCFRVDFPGGRLRLQMLNVAMIAEFLDHHPGVLRYEKTPSPLLANGNGPATQPVVKPELNNLLITDEPLKVRRFLEVHEDDPGFVCEPLILDDLFPIT